MLEFEKRRVQKMWLTKDKEGIKEHTARKTNRASVLLDIGEAPIRVDKKVIDIFRKEKP